MADTNSEDDEDLFGDGSDSDTPAAEKSTSTPVTTAVPSSQDEATTSENGTPSKAINEEKSKKTSPPKPSVDDTPIPRTTRSSTSANSPATSSPSKKKTGTPNADASRYGLPSGVNVPKSVLGANLLQGRLLDTLRSLPVNLINDALTEYDDAVQIKGEAIRNHGAYLYGVVKRYISVQERSQTGESQKIGPSLTPAVVARLGALVRDSFCTKEEMNDKIKSKIGMLSEKDAMFAIDELASVQRSQIRNFGSYFMGILNRYMLGKPIPASFKNKQHQPSHRQHADHDRFHHRPHHSPEPEFRQRGRNMMDDPNQSYRRERSRNRFDKGGGPTHAPPNSMIRQYDHRQSGAPSYHPPGRPFPASSVGAPPPPPPPPARPASGFPHHPIAPHGMQTAPQQAPFVPGGLPPSPGQPYANNIVQPPPVYPGAPSTFGGVPTRANPQGTSMVYGANNSVPLPPPPPSQVGQQPPHSSYMQQQTQRQSTSRFSQPGVGWQQQQQTQQPPNSQQPPGNAMDLFGLADKAASVVQALQNQNSIPPQVTPSQIPPSQTTYPPPMHQQQPRQPPNYQQATSYPSAMQPPNLYRQQNPTGIGRRRTTATMVDLVPTVQYAVQNLQVTRQIDGPLDEGILGMIKDLPEDLALQALNKFSSIDKNTMRNKTAYLAGVLRRELEKINRR